MLRTVSRNPDLGDSACRTIAFDRLLGPHDQVDVLISTLWTAGGSSFGLGAVTVSFTQA